MANELMTYEDAVRWLRSQPEHAELVKWCYLDEDNLIAAERFASSEEFSEVVSILRLNGRSKLRILDLGCGNGIASYAFAARGYHVTAVDPDESNDVGLGATARLSSVPLSGSITTHRACAESLPFSESTFDVVYARQALHHFQNLSKGLAECLRVLKKSGVLFASREHVIDDDQQLATFLATHPLHKWHGGENAYRLEHYIASIEQAGLTLTKKLAPFDTVINHYPTSNREIDLRIYETLQESYGSKGASLLIRIAPIKTVYRHRLSCVCHEPGRLYSFLCTKP